MTTRYEAKFQNLLELVKEPKCPIYIKYLYAHYLDRGLGTLPDRKQAKRLFRKIAETPGAYEAIEKDATTYHNGIISYKNAEAMFVRGLIRERESAMLMPKDIGLAIESYKIAAQADNADAQFELASRYETGITDEKEQYQLAVNLDLAIYFCELAKDNGHPHAEKRLNRILKKKQAIVTRSQNNHVNTFSSANKQLPSKSRIKTTSPVAKKVKAFNNPHNNEVKSDSLVYKELMDAGQSNAEIPKAKREESKRLNEKLDDLWNKKVSFYLTHTEIGALYNKSFKEQKTSDGINLLMLYSAYITGKLIVLIENNNVNELNEALEQLTNSISDQNQMQSLSEDIFELFYKPWRVAFSLALAKNDIDACALLIRNAAHSSMALALQQKLKDLAPGRLDEIQEANEKLMAEEESVPASLLSATKQVGKATLSPKLYGYFSEVYEWLYKRPEFKPILNLAYLAIKGQLNPVENVESFDHTSFFKIYVDEQSSNISRAKLNSNPTYAGVYTHGKGHNNAIYVGVTDSLNTKSGCVETKGTVLHETTHAILEKVLKNKCNPYKEDDKGSEKRLDAICFNLETKLMEKSKLPYHFQTAISYKANSMYSKLIVRVDEYLKTYKNQQNAQKALSSLDADLCELYFESFDKFLKNSYVKDDKSSENSLKALCLLYTDRLDVICFRFRTKMMKDLELPPLFKSLFSYKEQSVHSELFAYTAEYLSTFDSEEEASNALYLLDEDLYYFFNSCLVELVNHFDSLTGKKTYTIIDESGQLETSSPLSPPYNYSAPKTYNEPQPKSQSLPQSKSQSQSLPQTQPQAQLLLQPKSQSQSLPQTQPQVRPLPQPKPQSQSLPQTKLQARPLPQPKPLSQSLPQTQQQARPLSQPVKDRRPPPYNPAYGQPNYPQLDNQQINNALESLKSVNRSNANPSQSQMQFNQQRPNNINNHSQLFRQPLQKYAPSAPPLNQLAKSTNVNKAGLYGNAPYRVFPSTLPPQNPALSPTPSNKVGYNPPGYK